MIDIAQCELQRGLVMIITQFAIVNQRTHKPSCNRLGNQLATVPNRDTSPVT